MYQQISIFWSFAFVMLIFAVATCSPKKPDVDTGDEDEPCEDALTLQQIQDMYAMDFINMMNILYEIQSGRTEQLYTSIAGAIESNLAHMTDFEESSLKTVSFYVAAKYYEKAGKPMPAAFEYHFGMAMENAKRELSDDCYKLLDVCPGANCIAWPTSLRPVDLENQDDYGWHYLKKSHCGMKWPKIWKECGPPLNAVACY